MKLHNEDQAQEAIAAWQELSINGQLFHLKKAIDDQELSLMYYEQKGNEKGVLRAEKILEILKKQQNELQNN